VKKVLESQDELKLRGTSQSLSCAVHVNLLDENTNVIKGNTEVLLGSSKKICLEINAEEVNCIQMPRLQMQANIVT
jgi:hypothetical protein